MKRLLLLICLCACQKEPPEKAQPVYRVSLMELAPSKHHADSPPAKAAEVELTPSDTITPDALPASGPVKLRIHAMVPYSKTAAALRTLKEHGIDQLWLAVRDLDTSSPTIGWMEISGFRVFTNDSSQRPFEQTQQRDFEEFTGLWQQLYETCRTVSHDCTAPPDTMPTGGHLQLALTASKKGARLAFQQTDPPAKVQTQRVQVMDFDKESESGAKYVELKTQGKPPEQGMEAWFTFHNSAVNSADSPITAITAPVCGSRTCLVTIHADAATPSGHVLALIGAAFPDGTQKPAVAFLLP